VSSFRNGESKIVEGQGIGPDRPVANAEPAPAASLEAGHQPRRRKAPGIRVRLFAAFGGGRGHGLGLAIVQAVVQAHHGSVLAAANPGGGITVTMRLPAAEQQRP
jgi:hypothetical protein